MDSIKKSYIKNPTRDELMQLNKDELVDRIIRMEAHNTQLKNIITKNALSAVSERDNTRKKPFDFTKCHFRRILLHVMYFGWDYQGFAVQEGTSNTIEHELFHALIKACLIENRETANYHRCGRTDKGVSSFGQVISITLRSKFSQEEQGKAENIHKEIEYCKILNRLFPESIRALSWSPIGDDKPEFSARFDCKKRLYKYYFPRGDLDISAMNDGCKHLIGSHDFRNLCKMDVGNGVTTFIREIFTAGISPVEKNGSAEATSMYYFKIEGNAFLWHQIRCIFGVLMLIGQRKEPPDVIKYLLDIENYPRKPQYSMALDIPLNLYHCYYDTEQKWIWDDKELMMTIKHLQSLWTLQNVKATMMKDCIDTLEGTYKNKLKARQIDDQVERSERVISFHTECLLPGVKPKIYQPLLKRPTCSSLEERIEYYRKKRKTEEKAIDMECSDSFVV